jgi:UDP-N-acetylmuramate--alanine ligase
MTHVHLIGIGGTGISSIARVLLEKGYVVSGSDRALSPLALDLQQAGALVYEGHAAQNIHGADLVVRSSAISDNNVEVAAARALGIPVQKRADFLNTLLREYTLLAVAGSHGKTTTSTMLALTLDRLGLLPGFILGGVSHDLGTNARAGGGKYFVIEADEYDYMFLGLEPSLILVTNVEYDHPDCFPTREGYQTAFARFVGRLKSGGTLVTNADQAGAASLVNARSPETTSLTYGLSANSDVAARNLEVNQAGGMSFTLHAPFGSSSLASIDLLVPGEHNVRNALGVLAVQLALGNSLPAAVAAISTYHGSSRRFEIVGEINGITIIDDYAHHPSKIKATLAAARTRFPGRRLVAVWQPHTYSRTLTLEEDFINAFTDADLVLVTGIYASREKVQEYSVENLVKRITYVQALHIESLRDVTQFLARNLQPEDVLLVLSAGDADSVCREVILLLKERKG